MAHILPPRISSQLQTIQHTGSMASWLRSVPSGRTTSAVCFSLHISILWENNKLKINPFSHVLKYRSCMKLETVLILSLWEIKMVQIIHLQMTWRTTSAWSVPLNKKKPKVSTKTSKQLYVVPLPCAGNVNWRTKLFCPKGQNSFVPGWSH